ncbi:glycosyltransferase family 2 protein [Flavobacterium sp. RS13.1]|uniref:glycosyltransferase family 2 protein n=1 Tax=Flavobacterium sp. RS13.1 TaxID=3400345 RepID=UPI003AAC92F3
MNVLVSVIVPIYNVEVYLRECIDSVINQTLKDIEIILVDDGATDKSGSICDEYALIDNRIKVLHKINGGLSDARNAGLEIATAKYVSFIDSDDWVEPDFVEKLYNGCIQNKAEIACCGRIYECESYNYIKYTLNKETIYTQTEAIKHMLKGDTMDVASWDKMYERRFFDKYKFPKGEIHEDMAIIFDIFLEISKCVHVASPLYHYRQREQSITKQKFSARSLVILKNIKHTKALLHNKTELRKNVEAYYYRMIKNLCVVFLNSKDNAGFRDEFVSLKNELIGNFFKIFSNKDLKLSDKLSILSVISPFYVRIKKIYTAVRKKKNAV